MGGGSVQLTWVSKNPDGHVNVGPSVSLPYGAAALMSLLSTASSFEETQTQNEISLRIQQTLEKDLQISASQWQAAEHNGGFNLYLSGGGLRGWGHILMSQEKLAPYPMSTINGYVVSEAQFFSALDMEPAELKSLRISSRRISQVPAVKVIINAIKQSGLPISQVTFAQGGVREGLLFSDLPASIRAQSPLVTSTLPHAPLSASTLYQLMGDAVPFPVESEVLESVINLLYLQGPIPKDIRADAALRCTTVGVLAGAHGLSHRDRYLVALILCERWGGDVSAIEAPFFAGLQALCGPMWWWTRYIGRIAKGLADIFPAGVVPDEPKVKLQAGISSGENVSSVDHCWVNINVSRDDLAAVVQAWANSLEKLGQRKKWLRSKEGLKVDVKVRFDT